MNRILQRDLSSDSLRELLDVRGVSPMAFTDEQRDTLASRFRAVPTDRQRRLDAWTVENSGQSSSTFAWSPLTARRVLGNAALRYLERGTVTTHIDAVNEALADQLDRAARGHARPGTLALWLAGLSNPVLGIVTAEAVTWASGLSQLMERLGPDVAMANVDAYYDVAGARTSLRGRRDAVITTPDARIVIRFRAGLPTGTAGAGLRADLAVDALVHPLGQAAHRILGLWPEAGVALGVDGTEDVLRAGIRDFVRSAVTNHRQALQQVA